MCEFSKVRSTFIRITDNGVPNKKYYFDQDRSILTATVVGLEVLSTEDCAENFTWHGKPVVNSGDANLPRFFITLVNTKGEEVYSNVVPYTFVVPKNGGKQRLFLNIEGLDLKRSYIKFSDSYYEEQPEIRINFLVYLK